ncbi:MAG TPA: response regulator [Planctomycetota bacterium]
MEQPTVLVIEDDPVTRGLLEGILKVAQFKTVSAADAIEGVHAVRKQRPDLIIMDLMLPGVDGQTAAEGLLNDPAYSRIPILMLSASPDIEAAAESAGASEWMAKPFSPARLVKSLRLLLSQRRVTRMLPA